MTNHTFPCVLVRYKITNFPISVTLIIYKKKKYSTSFPSRARICGTHPRSRSYVSYRWYRYRLSIRNSRWLSY